MHAFPNNPYDGTQRIAGIWFVGRQVRSHFAHLSYFVHGMPARALSHPQSLTALPLLVNGRAVGNGPVRLSRGPHLVTSADKDVKIALLSVAPAALPDEILPGDVETGLADRHRELRAAAQPLPDSSGDATIRSGRRRSTARLCRT